MARIMESRVKILQGTKNDQQGGGGRAARGGRRGQRVGECEADKLDSLGEGENSLKKKICASTGNRGRGGGQSQSARGTPTRSKPLQAAS